MMQPIRMRTAIEMRLFTSGKASSSFPVLVLKVPTEVGRLHRMASFKEIRELLLFSVENNTIKEEEFFLLSGGFKSVNRLSNEKA